MEKEKLGLFENLFQKAIERKGGQSNYYKQLSKEQKILYDTLSLRLSMNFRINSKRFMYLITRESLVNALILRGFLKRCEQKPFYNFLYENKPIDEEINNVGYYGYNDEDNAHKELMELIKKYKNRTSNKEEVTILQGYDEKPNMFYVGFDKTKRDKLFDTLKEEGFIEPKTDYRYFNYVFQAEVGDKNITNFKKINWISSKSLLIVFIGKLFSEYYKNTINMRIWIIMEKCFCVNNKEITVKGASGTYSKYNKEETNIKNSYSIIKLLDNIF
jgi:hypothetical protein